MNISGSKNRFQKISYLILILTFAMMNSLFPSGKLLRERIVTSVPIETELRTDLTLHTSEIWLKMIRKARINIDMAFFYLVSEKNEILEPIVNQLINSSENGVTVRILTDKKMRKNSQELIDRFEKCKNIHVKIFDWSKITRGVLHAKYFIIDGITAFIGSQNFDWRSLKHIQETGIIINDSRVVSDLQRIFEADWQYNSGNKEAYKFPGKTFFAGNFKKSKIFLTSGPEKLTPPDIPDSLKTIIKFINSAKKHITIQLLNYNTYVWGSNKKFLELDDALRSAANRGVKIRMIVSNWNLRKPGIYSLKSLSKTENIVIKFITIPLSKTGFIPYARVVHSKVMRIDNDILMIGTSNWGRDYFYRSRNVELFMKSKKFSTILDKLFSDLWTSKYASKINPEMQYKRPKIY